MVVVKKKYKSDAGFVSLFTVIFFTLLITIITVGFLRLMIIEQQQATSNNLSATALATAETGVEEAKRAILAYDNPATGGPLKSALQSALSSTTCNALFQSPTIVNALGFQTDTSINGQSGIDQHYSCLVTTLDSSDYESSSGAGSSVIVPLQPVGGTGFEQVKVSWDLLSASAGASGDGTPSNYAPGQLLPPVTSTTNPFTSWSNQGYPPYLRVELFGYPSGNFSRTDIDQRTHAVVLIPNSASNAAAFSATTPIDMGLNDPRGFNQGKPGAIGVKCQGTPPSSLPIGSYACAATLQLPSINGSDSSNNNNYFLRVTPLYGAAHFAVQLLHNNSQVVNFNGVQPIIDSTGQTGDAYRRIQSRVTLSNNSSLPEFAAETVNTICKNMEVTDGSYYQPNNCP